MLYYSTDCPCLAQVVVPDECSSMRGTSVNGSSSVGDCVSFALSSNIITCRNPASMVTFDGNIPTLSRLDGNRWASELFTLETSDGEADITCDFQDFDTVLRVEIVMFNCPQWGIGVQSIALLEDGDSVISTINPSVTSCDSLVTVCLSTDTSVPTLTLGFQLSPGSSWVHLAEVTFYRDSSVTCSPDSVTTQPSPPLETTTQAISKFND